MPILKQRRIEPHHCKANPTWLYVFGDNMARAGRAGQAIIRDEPNAVGIPTKHAPSTADRAYFEDADLQPKWAHLDKPSPVKIAIDAAFAKLAAHLEADGTVIFPADGVGTGMAQLQTRAPAILNYINARIDQLKTIEPTSFTNLYGEYGIGTRHTSQLVASVTRYAYYCAKT